MIHVECVYWELVDEIFEVLDLEGRITMPRKVQKPVKGIDDNSELSKLHIHVLTPNFIPSPQAILPPYNETTAKKARK